MADNLDQIEDAAELRQLVRDARGENKVYLKIEPPSLDECEDYTVWKKKLEVWKIRTSMNAKQQAAAVIAGIMDDHKNHKKGLQTALMRSMTMQEAQDLKL